MSETKDQNEAACGGSALTAWLGALADQFECHAASRSIDDVEAAGRAMRAAKAEIKRLRELLQQVLSDAQAQDVLLEWWWALECDAVPNAKVSEGENER